MKDKLRYILPILLLQTLVNADILLVLNEDETKLDIFYNDILLFSQTERLSIFSLGTGTAEFVNTAGNFEITDEVTDLEDLPVFEVTEEETTHVTVEFKTEDSAYTVRFELREDVGESEEEYLSLEASLESPDGTYNRMFLRVVGEADERVYGAGEQYTYFNLKGRNFPIWTREQGVGRDNGLVANVSGGAGGDYHTTYWPQASFLSSRKYSMLLYNYEYLELDFTEKTRHVVYAHAVSLSASFLVAPTIRELVPKITNFLGRQPPLPDWILSGAVIAFENGSEEVMRHYDECVEAGVDIAGLWIQDWSGTTETNFGHRVYWNWQWNQTYYQDFDVFIEDLAADGVNMMVYVNCHLIEGSEMFEEADRQGYFLKNSNGTTFLLNFGGFQGGTIDVFWDEARNWYADQLRENMVSLGIKGWMADFGEYTDLEMISNIDVSPEALHNQYPVLWAETNRQIVEDANDTDLVYFMRSGALDSSSRQILAWAGDQNVDFSMGDGVATTVVAALSLAVSGMGVTHFDIGGFTTQWPALVRTEELLLRSAEYAVFTPVMRTHLGNKPEQNVQIYDSPELLSSFARLTKIHTRLFNYTKEVVRQNAEEGVPAQRPMFFHYENDSDTWDIQYQYMYGPDLIVAPVIHQDAVEVSVYIPDGDGDQWVDLWGKAETVFEGPQSVTVMTPLGFPAVFYRFGSEFAPVFESINKDFGLASP